MSNEPLLLLLLLQLIFILLNALFACAEIAVITMNDNRLAKLVAAGDKRAIRLARLTEQPAGFLATIQVGITVVNLLSSAVATQNFSERLSAGLAALGLSVPSSMIQVLSVAVITLVLTYFTVLLGELIPKRLAMKKAEQIALALSGLITVLYKIFTPAVWLFTVSTNALLRLIGIDPHSKDEENTEEEIRMMLDAGKQKGTIGPDEQYMIQNVFEFNDTSAEEIMTHRLAVTMLRKEDSDETWARIIHQHQHSVYPVCAESPDHIIGVLHARDYFRMNKASRAQLLEQAVRPAYFIPETVRADVLFRNMKKNRTHFAIVVDEYGGMSGIITMNDLLEQLVGDLEDDSAAPPETPLIERLDNNTWRIAGTAPLDDISRELGLLLPEYDYDTFGGLVFGQLGTIPEDGSTPELEAYGMHIRVTHIQGRRLAQAVVQLVSEQESG